MFLQQLYNVTLRNVDSEIYFIIIHGRSNIALFTVNGPDTLRIRPSGSGDSELSIKEGEALGPFDCYADCNPPCDVTWQYTDSYGNVHRVNFSKKTARLNIIVNRTIILLSCVGTYKTSMTLEQNMSLKVQCKSVSPSPSLPPPLSPPPSCICRYNSKSAHVYCLKLNSPGKSYIVKLLKEDVTSFLLLA